MKVETIVVGVDGSANARRALEATVDCVQPGGTIHVVTAFHLPTAGQTSEVLRSLPQEFRDTYDPLATPRSYLGNAEAFLKTADIDAVGHFVEDHPAAAILQVAEEVDADLIVVGSRGLGRGTRFLRGSVSTRVAGHAKTSFLVIHDHDHDHDEAHA